MQINQWPNKVRKFVGEVRAELKKVTWLSRRETIKYTLIVIGATLVLAAFLGGLDFFFVWVLGKIII